METATLFISLLLLFASLYYFFCKIILSPSPSPRKVKGYQLPPGSTGWPFIGETLEYLRTTRDGVPEKFIADRRKKYSDISLSSSAATGGSCKVFKTSLLGESMAMLCTAAGNKFLFSNDNKLVKTWYPTSFQKLFSGSKKIDFFQEAILSRKLVSPFLKPDGIRKHVGVMDQVTKHHFDTHWSPLDQNQAIKFHSLTKKYSLTLSCKLFLNNEDPEVIAKLENSIRHISAGLVSLPIDLPGTKFNRTVKTSIQMRKEVETMVAQRKIQIMNKNSIEREELENSPQDLMSSFLMGTYNDEEGMTEDIAKRLCGLLLGSYDTIINTLCSTVMFLSKLPPVYESVLKEQMEIAESKDEGELLNWDDIQKMKYTWNVVCEVLRLQPSFSGTYREAISDFVYEGFLIPKAMKLHWNVYATHKNPEYFADPHKFDPSRFEGNGPPPYSYIPFGGGPRMCPGKELARVQMLVFIHSMITRYKWEMVFPDEKMVADPLPFPTRGLPLHVFPHNRHHIQT